MKFNYFVHFGTMLLCMFFFSLQLQACQRKDLTITQAQFDETMGIPIFCINEIPEYYNIEMATMYCEGFIFSVESFIIKIEDVKKKKASIQLADEEQSKLYLPQAFCDTLAHYLYRFYVLKEPFILSKNKTNLIAARECLPHLKLYFIYNNQKFEDDIIIDERYEDNVIKFSPQYLEFRDWIRYLCDQFLFNHKNPKNAYW